MVINQSIINIISHHSFIFVCKIFFIIFEHCNRCFKLRVFKSLVIFWVLIRVIQEQRIWQGQIRLKSLSEYVLIMRLWVVIVRLKVSHWRHRLTVTINWVYLLLLSWLYGLESSLKMLCIIGWFLRPFANSFFSYQIWPLRILCKINLRNLVEDYPRVIAACNHRFDALILYLIYKLERALILLMAKTELAKLILTNTINLILISEN